MNYEVLVKKVESKGCRLLWSKEEFEKNFKDLHDNISIVSQCGHTTIVSYDSFRRRLTGTICHECIALKMKEQDGNLCEYRVIKGLQTFCADQLEMKVLDEGTMADVAFRPLSEMRDWWLPIQVKTTESRRRNNGCYAFMFFHGYTNMYIILFSVEDQRIWLADSNEPEFINRCTALWIGYKISIYSKFDRKTNHCLTCGTNIRPGHERCSKCFNKFQRRVERPSYEQLMKEIDESNYCQVAKKYGVTDNAIRKWKKNYEKEMKLVNTK